jgi:head-tail adaptor
VFELSKPKIKISDLSHRVALCTMHDVIDKNGNMLLAREAVTWLWAQIDAALNLPSFISPQGYAFHETQNAWASHRVIIRSASAVEATSAAWVYEQRRKSSPRWYKVLGFTESDNWVLLATHLLERSPVVTQPVNILQSQPSKFL